MHETRGLAQFAYAYGMGSYAGERPGTGFKVHEVRCDKGLTAARDLVTRIYRWKGYAAGHEVKPGKSCVAFLALDNVNGNPVGTLSVAFDGLHGLQADRLYADEVNCLRNTGRVVCEMTRFAIDSQVRSRQVLYALFEHAFIHAYDVRGADELLIEVNPAHISFYKRLLHFEVWGTTRHNPRVDAPGTLLRLNMDFAAQRMGRRDWDAGKRSMLPALRAPTRVARDCDVHIM